MNKHKESSGLLSPFVDVPSNKIISSREPYHVKMIFNSRGIENSTNALHERAFGEKYNNQSVLRDYVPAAASV